MKGSEKLMLFIITLRFYIPIIILLFFWFTRFDTTLFFIMHTIKPIGIHLILSSKNLQKSLETYFLVLNKLQNLMDESNKIISHEDLKTSTDFLSCSLKLISWFNIRKQTAKDISAKKGFDSSDDI